MNVDAILALIAELYANLGRANARIAELEATLAALAAESDDPQPAA